MKELVDQFLEDFADKYRYLGFTPNRNIRKYALGLLESDMSLDKCFDIFSDYLQSQGLCNVTY